MQNQFRQCLMDERVQILESLAQGAQAEKPVVLDQQSVGRLSRMDALQNQSMAKAASARRKIRIKRIDEALKRIDTGKFGNCLDCGEEISARRLENDPTHPKCLECAQG